MNNMISIEELKEICNGSAIMCQETMPSVKFYPDNGEILFIEKSRKLEIVSYIIPNWDTKRDCKMFFEMLDNNKEFKYCESSKYGGRYCYTISLLKR